MSKCLYLLPYFLIAFLLTFTIFFQLGIAVGFVLPPILVGNSDDLEVIGNDLLFMFYCFAGFTTVLMVLMIFCKMVFRYTNIYSYSITSIVLLKKLLFILIFCSNLQFINWKTENFYDHLKQKTSTYPYTDLHFRSRKFFIIILLLINLLLFINY